MKKTALLLMLSAIIQSTDVCSANDTGFENSGVLRLYFTFNSMHNKYYETESLRKIPFRTAGVEAEIYNYDKGGERWNFKCRMADDMIWLTSYIIKHDVANSPRNYYSVSGLIWYHWGKNVKGNSRFNFSPGFSFSDYMVIAPGIDTTGNLTSSTFGEEEPHGWYWAFGPNVFFDYSLGKGFTFHANLNYDFSFLRLSYKKHLDKSYKKPFIGGIDFQLNHRSGLFLQYTKTRVFDRGKNQHQIHRDELHIGMNLKLGRRKNK